MDDIEPSLLYEFVEEAREHLTSVEDSFMELEKSLESPDPETINLIFRAVHTVKGSCGFFGLTSIGTLAHTMETLLSLVRDNKLNLTSEILDSLLSGTDLLNAMINDVENSNEVDVSAVEEKISSYISAENNPVELPKISETAGDFQDYEMELMAKISPAEFLYQLRFNLTHFEKESKNSPVKLMSEISSLGEIIDGEIEMPEGDLRQGIIEGDTFYRLYFKTVLEEDFISGVTDIAPDMIRRITRDKTETAAVTEVAAASQPEEVVETEEVVEAVGKPEKSKSRESESAQKSGSNETLRVRIDILNELMMLAGELVLVRNQQLLQQDKSDSTSRAITQRLDIVTTDLQETIMRTRMQPVGNIFNRFTRIVRDIGKKLGKKIEIISTGAEVELDKNILEALTDPLTHIIRNSCDHGIEMPDVRREYGKSEHGTIRLSAFHEGGQINIQIIDDGAGLSVSRIKKKVLEKKQRTEGELALMSDKEALSLIFLPGLSTAKKVSDLSGRGVGMDVVKTSVESLGGVIDIDSEEGVGTTLNLRLPLTLAIIPSLIVNVGEERFAIPQVNLEELVCLYDEDVRDKIECVGNKEVYRLRDHLLPMVRLSELLANPHPFDEAVKGEITERNNTLRNEAYSDWKQAREEGRPYNLSLNFAVLKIGSNRFGLIIDSIRGTEEIVVKPMHRALKDLAIYSGATVLGDGAVALILDVLGLARHAAVDFSDAVEKTVAQTASDRDKRSLLLFSNEGEERFAVDMGDVKRVEKLAVKNIERVGNREFVTIDDISTRIIRLEECLHISSAPEKEDMFLILPKVSPHPYGVLTSKLLDIGEFELELNRDSYKAPGVIGSAILQDHMTLILNQDKIAQIVEPEWYQEEVM